MRRVNTVADLRTHIFFFAKLMFQLAKTNVRDRSKRTFAERSGKFVSALIKNQIFSRFLKSAV